MSVKAGELELVIYPDPRLRQFCGPVEAFDDDLSTLARRMLEVMRAEEGIGLAAPQVGAPLRMFVCNLTGDPADDEVYVNPRLEDVDGQSVAEEGCLSLPDVRVEVRRSESCRLVAFDLEGKPIERVGSEMAARCWQHEVDHLDGRLIIDRMSETDRIANRRALKELEAKYRPRKKATR